MLCRMLWRWRSDGRKVGSGLFGRRKRRRRRTFLDKVSYVVGKESFEFGTFLTVKDESGSVGPPMTSQKDKAVKLTWVDRRRNESRINDSP